MRGMDLTQHRYKSHIHIYIFFSCFNIINIIVIHKCTVSSFCIITLPSSIYSTGCIKILSTITSLCYFELTLYSDGNCFSSLFYMCISVFEVRTIYLINNIQNTIPRLMLLHELKKSLISRVFHAHEIWSYWSSENTPHVGRGLYQWAGPGVLSLNGQAAAHHSALEGKLATSDTHFILIKIT